MSRPDGGADDQGFLGRWSRRKLAEPEEVATPEAEAAAEPEPAVEKTDAEILDELGLPDPDGLAEGDDFSGFMKGAVPTRLRNRALRKLWLSNPVLANIDDLVDYGEDYTDAATVVENMQTAYQVGKGWLRDPVEETAEDTAEQTAEDEEAAGNDTADASPADTEAAAAPADQAAPGDQSDDQTEMAPGDDHALAAVDPVRDAGDSQPSAPRRMRFCFPES